MARNSSQGSLSQGSFGRSRAAALEGHLLEGVSYTNGKSDTHSPRGSNPGPGERASEAMGAKGVEWRGLARHTYGSCDLEQTVTRSPAHLDVLAEWTIAMIR